MNLKMNKNSLFAILLRSPWWASVLIAAGLIAVARLVIPEAYAPYAYFAALPFLVIAGVAGWRQLRAPSAARVADTLETVRAMSWSDLSAAIEDAFRRDGYMVNRLSGAPADFELTKARRMSLVSCKRWKVARTGIEPLRDLYAATRARDAYECIYIAAGEITDQARAFAVEKNIRLVTGVELARLLALAARARSPKAK